MKESRFDDNRILYFLLWVTTN